MSDPTKWNADALARLGQNAQAFGKTWAALKEALVQQGATEQEARGEARAAATMAAIWDRTPEGGDCPLCGGTGEAP